MPLPFLLLKMLFGNPKLLMIIALVVAVVGFAWDWQHRGIKIEHLQAQVLTLQANLQVAQAKEALAEDAQKVLVARLTQAGQQAARTTQIAREAHNAPPSHNAPVAPVVRDALAGLRGLQQPHPR